MNKSLMMDYSNQKIREDSLVAIQEETKKEEAERMVLN
jgi:hypothetical protein